MNPPPAGLNELKDVFTKIISAAVGLGFVALLLLLIWSGFKYLTSGGEPKAIASARDTMTWAFLGVIFLAIAWLILQIIQSFTGVSVTSFNLGVLCNVGGKDFCSPSPTP